MATTKRDADSVTLKLAHPLEAKDAVRLGAKDQDYGVDEEIVLTRDRAQSLIGSGWAQVDPEDQQAVRKALGKGQQAATTTAAEPSATSGNN